MAARALHMPGVPFARRHDEGEGHRRCEAKLLGTPEDVEWEQAVVREKAGRSWSSVARYRKAVVNSNLISLIFFIHIICVCVNNM